MCQFLFATKSWHAYFITNAFFPIKFVNFFCFYEQIKFVMQKTAKYHMQISCNYPGNISNILSSCQGEKLNIFLPTLSNLRISLISYFSCNSWIAVNLNRIISNVTHPRQFASTIALLKYFFVSSCDVPCKQHIHNIVEHNYGYLSTALTVIKNEYWLILKWLHEMSILRYLRILKKIGTC